MRWRVLSPFRDEQGYHEPVTSPATNAGCWCDKVVAEGKDDDAVVPLQYW